MADSRFQERLKREAQAAGKLQPDYRIPEAHRHNNPRALEERFVLAKALSSLMARTSGGWVRVKAAGDIVQCRLMPIVSRRLGE